MEIEFNPSRAPWTEGGQPVVRPDKTTTRASTPEESSASTASLQDKLHAIPLLRANVVDRALSLADHVKYPPDDLVDRIAALLSKHLSS